MKNKQTLMLVETAVMVAFAYVLSLFRVVEMPQGGSVSLAMLPIFVIALRWGGVPGMVAGLLFSATKLLTEPYIVHPIQALLDYPLAFASIGLAGFFKDKPLAGITVGGLSRLLCHFLSGAVFFAAYAPAGQSIYLYSFVYNITYMGPEILIALIVAPLVMAKVMPMASQEFDLRRNLVEIVSFVVPLAAMAVMLTLEAATPATYAALAFWGLLAAHHALTFRRDFSAAKRGLLLVTVPPAVVYIVHLLITVF
jgi:thiamine transporter